MAPAVRHLCACALLVGALPVRADGPSASGSVGLTLVIPPHLGARSVDGDLCLTARNDTPLTLLTAGSSTQVTATRNGPCLDPAQLAAGTPGNPPGTPVLLVIRPE